MKEKLILALQHKGLIAQIITENHQEALQEFIDYFDDFFLLCEGEKGTARYS
ncbi:hypothetical protein [Rickettsiales endosymbiont of Stachyamoeba lipophora]|uniref:hypothetical protein n=1 Tax=Rickettsiales endosymbiont of Stachyamoeba lipophora TaxID=2486578 RepID=UPI0013DE359E|nr:hypothetical protein [Rickettsiales endosymbiont of Stachyamoeba lipophora]